MRVDIVLTCAKHLHDHIISLKGQVGVNKTSLIPPYFILVPVPSQKSERSYSFVLRVSNLPLSTILILDFGTVPSVW